MLDPDIAGQKFTGEETITVQVQQATSEIVLNSLGLDISLAEVTSANKTLPAKVTYDQPNEIVRLSLAQPLPAGGASLHLKFSGKLTAGLRGLYLSKSARRQYAVTQFEGTYARMMFPGFDEPAFKATFDLSVIADKGDTAFSNGKQVSDVPGPAEGKHTVTFAPTAKMSTYLVAMVVGDLVIDGPRRVHPQGRMYDGRWAIESCSFEV